MSTEPQLKSTHKKKINLKIDPHKGAIIDRAAALAGRTRTDFMVEASYQAAQDLLLDQTTFYLSEAGWDTFLDILDNPPEPSPTRQALMERKAFWE